MIMKKQWAIASPMTRFSLMQGLRDLVFVVLALGFYGRGCSLSSSVIINLSGLDEHGRMETRLLQREDIAAYQRFYTPLSFYNQNLCKCRVCPERFTCPGLMFISPLAVFVFSFGGVGKKVTLVWLKEF